MIRLAQLLCIALVSPIALYVAGYVAIPTYWPHLGGEWHQFIAGMCITSFILVVVFVCWLESLRETI